MHENNWANLEGYAYKQHPLMFKSTVKEVFVIYTLLQTFEPMVHIVPSHSLCLHEVSVYILITVLEKCENFLKLVVGVCCCLQTCHLID